MLRCQWLMQTASWVWSLDLNLPPRGKHQACTHHPLCTTGALIQAARTGSSRASSLVLPGSLGHHLRWLQGAPLLVLQSLCPKLATAPTWPHRSPPHLQVVSARTPALPQALYLAHGCHSNYTD